MPAVHTLIECGVRCLEITLPTPGSLDAIAAARKAAGPDTLISAGTVLTAEQVHSAADAGAETVRTAVARARANGTTVSFDANYRRKLWGRDQTTRALRDLMPGIDIHSRPRRRCGLCEQPGPPHCSDTRHRDRPRWGR
ncbi:hypothetical protein [Streptacidiphilus sp. PAMC 29251]